MESPGHRCTKREVQRKRRPSSVKYKTAIATIGIRAQVSICVAKERAKVANAHAAQETKSGLIVVRRGNSASVERPQGKTEVTHDQIMLIPADGGELLFLAGMPGDIEEAPRGCRNGRDPLRSFSAPDVPKTGLYLAPHEGYCLMGECRSERGRSYLKSKHPGGNLPDAG
ncbi:MAG: hypothetical protein ACU84Q_14890 [Gammaproteobacteria bacterium]